MPSGLIRTGAHIEYWYGEDEMNARRWYIEYVREKFPEVMIKENKGQDHAEFFTLHPEEFCTEIISLVQRT